MESELGVGSTFYVDLLAHPRDEEKEGEPEGEEDAREAKEVVLAGVEAGSGAVSLRDRTILVIDDESDSRILLAHFLEDFGCTVLEAGNGREGLDMAREHSPDLITLDLMMPEMTGWEVLQNLKDDPDLQDIPVVVVSIVAGEGRGRVLGAQGLLTKPVERDDLLRMISRHMPREYRRALVVEESRELRDLLHDSLVSAGFEVALAEDGSTGMELLEAFDPDLVLTGHDVPAVDGRDVLGTIRGNPDLKHLPVVVLTAEEPTPEERSRLQAEAASVVRTGPDLGERVREVLEAVFAGSP